jgi:hypothetical protein
MPTFRNTLFYLYRRIGVEWLCLRNSEAGNYPEESIQHSEHGEWSLSLSSHQQNPLRTSPVSHTCQMPRPFHSSLFDHSNNILWGIQSIRGPVKWFVISCLLLGVFSTLPNPQAGTPPLVGCPRLLIQYIHSYPPYQEPVPLYATWGRAMLWRQGFVYYGAIDNEQ